jgi:hypothetical protein
MKKETETILGKDIQITDENRTWRCTVKTTDGKIVTIPFEVISKLLVDYNIVAEKLRSHYRAKEIVKNDKI